jgi:hypothetical protein
MGLVGKMGEEGGGKIRDYEAMTGECGVGHT